MVLTGYSFNYIIAGAFDVVILSIFIILLLRHFFSKRTIGTLMLIMAYGNIFINEILATTAFILESLYPTNINIILYCKILQIIGVFLLVYSINWMYFFGNRHLIRDNDFFKSIYTIVFGTITGGSLALALNDILTDVPIPVWYSEIDLAGVDFNIYYPAVEWPTIILIGLIFVIGSYTYIRISFRTFQLQRKAKDVVAKKGFIVITWSILLLLMTGLFLGVYIFGAGEIAIVSALMYVIRGMIVLAAVITGYIGWIMPDWIRKRFRGKAWITQVYTGKIPEPPKNKANIDVATESNIDVVEVSEM
ncbi:MAG: hypothetical protein EAX90_02690 [Candidatus Heimdallarchaeota archaeon]|nr:hypothetical protein [Candidatus Heimdallarchaeota archaeon]